MHRKNDKNKKSKGRTKKELTGDQKREQFYRDNADKARLINTLEEVGIFKFPE
jgi:hypothetical protein